MKHLEIATSLVENTKAVDSFQEHGIIVKMRTASIRTVERERSSLYGEKLSPGGPHTGVDHEDYFYHHILPSKGMTVPLHDKNIPIQLLDKSRSNILHKTYQTIMIDLVKLSLGGWVKNKNITRTCSWPVQN